MQEQTNDSYENLGALASKFRDAGDESSEDRINLRLLCLDLQTTPDLWPLVEHSKDMEWK